MKYRKVGLTSVIIILASQANLSALPEPYRTKPQQRPNNKAVENNHAEMTLSYDFSVPGETSRVNLLVAIPKTLPPKQKILDIQYSPQPARFISTNGNHYAYFLFVHPKKRAKVVINIKAELFRYDLATAKEKGQTKTIEEPAWAEFLKQEKYIEKDNPEVQQTARSIQGQTEIEKVKSIYNYVTENMEYIIQGKQDRGCLYALEQQKGDCSEYADLFVALCRAKNIPARVATGYTVRFDDISPKHHWAEVYLQTYGWVPFDPSWGDVENASLRNFLFEKGKPVYIYLTHIRNDPMLFNNHFFVYSYRGDEVTLENSVEFKQSAGTIPAKH